MSRLAILAAAAVFLFSGLSPLLAQATGSPARLEVTWDDGVFPPYEMGADSMTGDYLYSPWAYLPLSAPSRSSVLIDASVDHELTHQFSVNGQYPLHGHCPANSTTGIPAGSAMANDICLMNVRFPSNVIDWTQILRPSLHWRGPADSEYIDIRSHAEPLNRMH